MTIDHISKDYDHKKEVEWQSRWLKDDIYRFLGDGIRPSYIIDTPPPYPTGSIHMGHVLNWVYMDIIARFRRMKGYDVLFPQGWDCHGLPTEVKVEESHNIKKSDLTRDEFRKMCVEFTQDNIKTMKSQMLSLGFSQDWSREYVTMNPDYMRKTQLSFLNLYKDGLIYRAVHPVNWCPRCETAIAFAEVEYHENETNLNYLGFREAGGKGNVLIATTRPELLSACVAVTVHPEDERYQNLAGKYLEVPLYNRQVKVITDEDVDPEFGTGAVMICTFGDKTDVSWVNRYGLDVIEAIDERGAMTDVAGKYVGCTLEECKESITEDLKTEGFLQKQEKVKQNLGLCWRCKTPIEILIKKQWFVTVKKIINKIKEASDEIEWIPPYMKKRLLNWTVSMDWDWVISRQRIFATPIPVWYCSECGNVVLASEEKLPVDPNLDKPQNRCECGCGEFVGEEDVLDTWMDSSITPLVIAGWPSPSFQDLYPSSLRPQGHDILRTWAFYTILRCKVLTGIRPFDEIVVNGMVFGEDGHKMSKSRGNVITPEDVINEYGADALRLWASNSIPGSDVPFAWKDVQYGYKFLRKFWNAFRFINMHIADYKMEKSEKKVLDNLKPLDKWILSKLNRVVREVTDNLESYRFADAISLIQSFIWHDFCDEYIESVKYRLYSNDPQMRNSKLRAKYTLKTVIITSLRLLFPITPHFTEEIHQHLGREDKSIHTSAWPEVLEELIDHETEELGEVGVEIIGELRRFKSKIGMPLNTPLKSMIIYTSDEKLYSKVIDVVADIKGTMKIEEVQINMGKPEIQDMVTEITPLMARIGPEFREDAPLILKYLQSHKPQKIATALDCDGEILVGDLKLTWNHIKVKREVVGKTGEKVEILHPENLDAILEIVI